MICDGRSAYRRFQPVRRLTKRYALLTHRGYGYDDIWNGVVLYRSFFSTFCQPIALLLQYFLTLHHHTVTYGVSVIIRRTSSSQRNSRNCSYQYSNLNKLPSPPPPASECEKKHKSGGYVAPLSVLYYSRPLNAVQRDRQGTSHASSEKGAKR